MLHFETCHDLDPETLERILGLIDINTKVDGHRPIGEHKYAHLTVGAEGWTGVLARTDDEDLVGYAHTLWNPAGVTPRMSVEVVVHPDVRGDGAVARKLIANTKAVLAEAGGGVMWLWVHYVEDPRTTLAYDMGFDIQRELAFMRRDMLERPRVPPVPDGIELATYRPDVDDEDFLRVNNAAFVGHPENGSWNRQDLAERRARDWFDAGGLFMAWRRPGQNDRTEQVSETRPDSPGGDARELLGFHWTKWHGHASDEVPAHEPVGEVYVLAVHPSAQGLGLGRLLLQRGLAHLWDEDCRQAILYVDRASEDAVRLYASAGFSISHSEVCYHTEVEGRAGP